MVQDRRGARMWSWAAPAGTGVAVGLLALHPAWLVPVADGYQSVCARYRPLARLTHRAPPLSLALVLAFVLVVVGITGMMLTVTGIRAWRFNRRLSSVARPLPPRLEAVGAQLGLMTRLVFLPRPELAAFCYGLWRPRIAITAGLVAALDDEELTAVLAHERHHLRRRDPMRYLVLHAVGIGGAMFPIVPSLKGWIEARLELAADRAALAVAPRGALAGALLAVLSGGEPRGVGTVGLSATEARVAHLAGRSVRPALSRPAAAASLALVVLAAASTRHLAALSSLAPMACALCARLR